MRKVGSPCQVDLGCRSGLTRYASWPGPPFFM